MHKQIKSAAIFESMKKTIPGGVNSPVRSFPGLDTTPLIVERGVADTIYDADGNSYIDYCCSWGPLILGHAHPTVIKACQERLAMGSSFGISTEIEGKLAKKVVSLIDSIEKIRFVSSGTEACMSAVRLARGYTGRDLIIKFIGNYHGHADHFLVQAGSGLAEMNATSTSAGIPHDAIKNTLCLPYNDCEKCLEVFHDPRYRNKIAAVILEPVSGNMGVIPATQDFVDLLRKETKKSGTLLIFDEVMTGFRVALKGAQSLYKVAPDLTCFAKVIGGGFPVAAFGGRADIMDYLAPLGSVYQAGTLSGNPVAMEAGYQTLCLIEQPGFFEELERKSNRLTQPVRQFLKDHDIPACIQQEGSMFTLFFGLRKVNNMEEAKNLDTQRFAAFFRHMLSRGVYVPPSQYEAWFVSAAHTDEHLDYTANAIIDWFS